MAELISACVLGDCIPWPERSTEQGVPSSQSSSGASPLQVPTTPPPRVAITWPSRESPAGPPRVAIM
eukprot:192396-Prymnesium_polylepis.1